MSSPLDAKLCCGCFALPAGARPCPECGFDPATPRPPNALPLGSVLDGKYVVGRVLGSPGGFGITYLAFDLRLETRVAIKEYLPRDLATRAADRTTVVAHTTDEDDRYRYGLEQFLTEARTTARLDHPNIVRVRSYFEANGTAYLVMDYYRGTTLAEYLERQPAGRLPEDKALALMRPVLDGLRAVHAKGLLHRDIKPSNLYLAQTDTGGVRPILLDFGAARQAMAERSHSMSVVLTEGYAPFEQYHRKGRQGPWTDIYAAAAVLYRMVTGETPLAASERTHADELVPPVVFGTSAILNRSLLQALDMRGSARPQTVEDFQRRLFGNESPMPIVVSDPPPDPRSPAPGPERAETASRTEPRAITRAGSRRRRFVLAAVSALFLLTLAGILGRSWLATAHERFDDQWFDSAHSDEQFRTYLGFCWLNGCRHRAEAWVRAYPAPARAAAVAALGADALLPIEPRTVSIRAGYFWMGSANDEPERDEDEGPRRVVQVPAFAIGRSEVTRDQWAACVADGGCMPTPVTRTDANGGNPQLPMTDVSWDQANQYTSWLKDMTGKPYRLPTEAEWEYAARAGTDTPFASGPCPDPKHINYGADYRFANCEDAVASYRAAPVPVESLQPNPWGLHEMAGNVWEWTQDCYVSSYADAPADGSARLGAGGSCDMRVLRGGAWYLTPRAVRSAYRGKGPASSGNIVTGLRVALD
jgi:formylglycine-generating enzyme required for sulfatase activity/serine/threonine protein kinase